MSTQFQNQTIKACSCFRQSQSAKLHLHEKRHGGPTTGIFTADGGEYLPEKHWMPPTDIGVVTPRDCKWNPQRRTHTEPLGQQPFFWEEPCPSNMCFGDTRWPLRPTSGFLKDSRFDRQQTLKLVLYHPTLYDTPTFGKSLWFFSSNRITCCWALFKFWICGHSLSMISGIECHLESSTPFIAFIAF